MTRKDIFDYVKPFTSNYVKPIIDTIKNRPLYSSIILFIVVCIILFFSVLSKAIVITLLIMIGGVSKTYLRYTSLPLGVELVMFSTVVSSFLYGSLIGVVVGITTFAIATHLSSRYTVHAIISFFVYAFAGALTPLFSSVSFAGIVFSIIFVTVLSSISLIFMLSRPHRTAMFAITNLAWNFWIFLVVAPKIVSFLS